MKKVILLIAMASVFSSMAQKVELSNNQLNANILPLTVSYERKIDDNKSFTLNAGVIPSVNVETRSSAFSSTTETYSFFQPYISASVRNYYERNKVKKKNLKNNSGNYIALHYSHWFKPIGSTNDVFEQRVRDRNTNSFTIGPVWGFERNYASGIHLDLRIGVGYGNGEFQNTGDMTFIGEFVFGFVLFSK